MTIPPIVFDIVLILHFVGLASLLGGVLVQIKDTIAGKGRIVAAMFHGALLQIITGLVLVGFIEIGDGSINNWKIATKLAIVILITVVVLMFRKKTTTPSWAVWTIGVLTLANIVIAVLWH